MAPSTVVSEHLTVFNVFTSFSETGQGYDPILQVGNLDPEMLKVLLRVIEEKCGMFGVMFQVLG